MNLAIKCRDCRHSINIKRHNIYSSCDCLVRNAKGLSANETWYCHAFQGRDNNELKEEENESCY